MHRKINAQENNIQKKRTFLLLVVYVLLCILCVLLTLVFTSCKTREAGIAKNESQKEVSESTSEEALREEEPVQKVEITIWDSCEAKERLALVESNDNFMKENPSIKIETRHFRSQEELEDQFEAASLAGSGPELVLMSMDSMIRLASSNVLKEITSEVDYNRIIDGLVEISRYNGRNYIIPFRSSDFLVFFYNKDLVEEAPTNFEGVIEHCKKVNDFKKQIYGWLLNEAEPDWIIPFIGGYSDWIVDYDSYSLALDNKATEKTLEFLNYIYSEEKILPYEVGYEEMNQLFKNGSVSMIINGTWAIEEYKNGGLNFGISKIPIAWQGSKNPTPLISGTGFMINVNCYGNELEAIKAYIDYMLSEEIQISWTWNTQSFPVLKDIDSNSTFSNDELIYEAFQQAKICRGKPYDKLMRVIRDAFRTNIENVIRGNITPSEAVVKIQEDAIKLRSEGLDVEELKK
ncbi:MAG: extracellular solute-binding protein [Actinobacteria bacterium]|nr:extracellular solute-binding protein [Actinomycetota bacterium]